MVPTCMPMLWNWKDRWIHVWGLNNIEEGIAAIFFSLVFVCVCVFQTMNHVDNLLFSSFFLGVVVFVSTDMLQIA